MIEAFIQIMSITKGKVFATTQKQHKSYIKMVFYLAVYQHIFLRQLIQNFEPIKICNGNVVRHHANATYYLNLKLNFLAIDKKNKCSLQLKQFKHVHFNSFQQFLYSLQDFYSLMFTIFAGKWLFVPEQSASFNLNASQLQL